VVCFEWFCSQDVFEVINKQGKKKGYHQKTGEADHREKGTNGYSIQWTI
jgi:hypothetical protein